MTAVDSGQDPAHGYPQMAAAVGRVEPAPRRVRGMLGGTAIFDTTSALYVWEVPYYPQYYVPIADVLPDFLDHAAVSHREGLAGYVRFRWAALDAWFEEDEEVFVHPRSPYVRVDALRSHRSVRVELDGVVLAESSSPVMVFETGLPTRYYLDRTDVRFEHLIRTDTVSECPYKGVTSDYWSVLTPAGPHVDLAWAYRSTTAALGAVAGLVAFYDEKVDVLLEGELQSRPVTHF